MPLLCIQYETPDNEQKTCPKHVEIYSKNKFEKLVHLVGFIIRIYHSLKKLKKISKLKLKKISKSKYQKRN